MFKEVFSLEDNTPSANLEKAVSPKSKEMQEEKFVSTYELTFESFTCLGEGCFGEVFKAKQKSDETYYAIKRIPFPRGEGKLQHRVVTEVKTLAQFQHTNIARYHDSWIEEPPIGWTYQCDNCQDDEIDSAGASSSWNNSAVCRDLNYLFIQIQFCPGESLRQWLLKNPSRERCVVLLILKRMLNAIDYIHSKGVIHGDLKPHNIFLTADYNLKIGDFGLAAIMATRDEQWNARSQNSTSGSGTLLYTCPEVLENRYSIEHQLKVDIYSMGIIWAELLVPFKSVHDRYKTLKGVRGNSFPPGFRTDFPHEMELIQQMLLNNPSLRPSTGDIKLRLLFTPVS